MYYICRTYIVGICILHLIPYYNYEHVNIFIMLIILIPISRVYMECIPVIIKKLLSKYIFKI